MAGNRVLGGTGVALLIAAGLAAPALAQSASDYRLPGATGTPTTRAAGPVDPSDPTSTLPRARPGTAPSAAPSSAPVATAPAPVASASPAPRATMRSTAAPRSVPTRAAAAVAPQPAPQPSASAPAPTPSESAAPASPLPTIPPSPQANLVSTDSAFDWRPWAAALLALLTATGVLLWRRRNRPGEPEIDFELPVVTPAEPQSAPAAQSVPAPAPVPATPAPRSAAPAAPLTLTLEARRLTASLMATSFSYALRLTNTGTAPLTALAVEADLVSAHASLPVERQIANDGHRLELRHAQVELAPGESVEFTGDLRLPLTEVTPIRAGGAAYFVPLARFRIEAGDQVLVQTFVIGELPEQAGGALRPFRLDLGPRTYSQVGQRAVA